ncbi:1040_t:CDS:2, partial [Racocetra persica]
MQFFPSAKPRNTLRVSVDRGGCQETEKICVEKDEIEAEKNTVFVGGDSSMGTCINQIIKEELEKG